MKDPLHDPGKFEMENALCESEHLWKESQILFTATYFSYMRFVLNALSRSREIYWANRFGSELYRISQSLIPIQRYDDRQHEHSNRQSVIARHISDFNLHARHVIAPLLREAQNRERP